MSPICIYFYFLFLPTITINTNIWQCLLTKHTFSNYTLFKIHPLQREAFKRNIESLTTVELTPSPPPPLIFDCLIFFIFFWGGYFFIDRVVEYGMKQLFLICFGYFDHGNNRNTNYHSDKSWKIIGEMGNLQGQITLKICDIWSLEGKLNMFLGFLEPQK